MKAHLRSPRADAVSAQGTPSALPKAVDQVAAEAAATGLSTRAAAIVIAFLGFGYLLQIASPLRLNGDAIEYLWVAASIADGRPYAPVQDVAPFPFGYPALIAIFDRSGWMGPHALVALNLIGLAAGLCFSCAILRLGMCLSRGAAVWVCALAMSSWVVIKHAVLPMSDLAFFAAAMASLLASEAALHSAGTRRWLELGAGAGAALLSIELRVIGIALIPPLLWSAAGGAPAIRRALHAARTDRRRATVGVVAFAGVVALGFWSFSRSEYCRRLLADGPLGGPLGAVAEIAGDRFSELGEIAVNLPQAKLPVSIGWGLPIVGALVLAAALLGAWRRRRVGPSEVYLIGGGAILFTWPFPDARLWIPLLPLLIAYAGAGLRAVLPESLRPAALRAYRMVFCALGAVALAYSARISFSGERFPALYGGGSEEAAYRAAFGGSVDVSAERPEFKAVYVLRRYQRVPPGSR